MAYAFGVMAVGEFFALRVLALGESTKYDVAIVGGSLFTAAAYIVLLAILGPMQEPRDEEPETPKPHRTSSSVARSAGRLARAPPMAHVARIPTVRRTCASGRRRS